MNPFYQDQKESRVHRFSTLDYAPHLHSALEIGFLETGSSILRVEGREYALSSGTFFAVFPNLIHSFEMSLDATGFIAILTPEDLAPFYPLLSDQFPSSPVLPAGSWEHTRLAVFLALAAEEGRACPQEIKKGYCRILAGKLLPLLTTQKRELHNKSTLREVLTYLASHSGENISRKTLARSLGISESTVSHLFSETFHTSLPAYLNRLRLEQAARLLEESDLSVTQVAINAGFGSLRSFNRAFRQNFHLSPREYRKTRLSQA